MTGPVAATSPGSLLADYGTALLWIGFGATAVAGGLLAVAALESRLGVSSVLAAVVGGVVGFGTALVLLAAPLARTALATAALAVAVSLVVVLGVLVVTEIATVPVTS
ncbi:MAG: hypothetical protein ABEJ26_10065 [Halosimplex sp.]